jgi:peroxiredoxin
MYKLAIIIRRPDSISPAVEDFTMVAAQIIPIPSVDIPICDCPIKNDEELVAKAICLTPIYQISATKVHGQSYLYNLHSDSSLEEVYMDFA